jgi:hypothetical protein
LGKSIANDFEIDISSIKKEKENAYSYMRNYTFYGTPRTQKMVGFDDGPGGSHSLSYDYWPGRNKADEEQRIAENSQYSDIFG